MKLDLITSFA